MKEVLVLGAGLVAKPLVRYLLERAGFGVTVASRTMEKGERMIAGHQHGRALAFDITRDDNLKDLVEDHDLVVSLLPYAHHTEVARAAIHAGKHMATTSYVSGPMKELDGSAKDAGVLLINEMGLDPGIDHMEAQRVIDDVHSRGGRVEEFISYCGGLPAPEANTNPWGYKFSWSPKGVVLASKNNARFRKNGEEIDIPGRKLFANYDHIEVHGLGTFEGYPNRDSVPYAEIYGIPDARTVLRGTLRNMGWCDTWKGLHDIGVLEEKKTTALTYHDMMKELAPGVGELKDRLKARISTKDNDLVIRNWEWLGLMEERELLDDTSRMDALSELLQEKLFYGPGERDMIVLQHTFNTVIDGERQTLHSTMIDYGISGGDSAMSRTVGIPAAIGAELILTGKLDHLSGVQIPILPEIYKPALEKLQEQSICFKETCG
ncbi:MAG: saccharopine dehydrogenase C-terminal domain-containing protein [Thermoplasmatota archaeon]